MDAAAYFKQLQIDCPEKPLAVCAVESLTEFLRESTASTFSELLRELESAISVIKGMEVCDGAISVTSGCDLFKRYISRINAEIPDFQQCKTRMLQRGEAFTQHSERSRDNIAEKLFPFLKDKTKVLVHGFSRVVLHALVHALGKNRRLHLYVTEGLPNPSGVQMAKEVRRKAGPNAEVTVTIIRDTSVACVIPEVDCVLVGAEGVVESGGIVNKVGTFQLGIVARSLGKPFYVAVETFKFVRFYPLQQRDVQQPPHADDRNPFFTGEGETVPEFVEIDRRALDYTPPEYITLLFTENGLMTTSAVSDELIKLYYEPLQAY
eukprot:TRINITY_DN98675_c0_g1_i1.p2 TRINITY_DN98675_c0_g1~~TRINITY_DN98675_c0_g1_i1.p2  ORF type:complete len:363 (-),score=91.48 TRINITY_DN98675_c0_g1_i1:92-1054(-)